MARTIVSKGKIIYGADDQDDTLIGTAYDDTFYSSTSYFNTTTSTWGRDVMNGGGGNDTYTIDFTKYNGTSDSGVHTTINETSGTDKIMVYWRSATISYSNDRSPLIGQANMPIIQEYDLSRTNDFTVYSVGTPDAVFRPVNLLESLSYPSTQTAIQLNFVNNSSKNIYLLAFAILYV